MDKLAQELHSNHSQGKRYTYYPPVSTWNEANSVEIDFQEDKPWSLYIHLPFCRELCTFCGCNIKVTKDELEQLRYIDALIAEFRNLKFKKPNGAFTLIFGGGSPNSLSLKALQKLRDFIKEEFPAPEDSLCEIDPRNFTQTQASLFFDLGIKRFSFGVQDFDSRVLKNVNRNQTLDQLEKTASLLRKSATFGIDLLWGMPLQENDPFANWQEGLEALKPDWINYYPMATVSGLAAVQEAYGDFTLPAQKRKYELYSEGCQIFKQNNYTSIGMGHYLLNNSQLLRSFESKEITRSVSGLFFHNQDQVLGLGVSAISKSNKRQWQNQKILERYLFTISRSECPVFKVHENRPIDFEMAKIIDDVILERYTLHDQDEKFPRDWFGSPQADSLRPISIKGRHFKKNILQVLENDLIMK